MVLKNVKKNIENGIYLARPVEKAIESASLHSNFLKALWE